MWFLKYVPDDIWISSSHGIRGLEWSLVSNVLFIDIHMKVLVEKLPFFKISCCQGLGNGLVEDHYATRYQT